jgi:Family of unknown function (DUF6114)
MSEPEPAAGPAEDPAEPAALTVPTVWQAPSPAGQTAEFAAEDPAEPAALTVPTVWQAPSPAEQTMELAAEQPDGPVGQAPESEPGRVHRARAAFRGWRRGRPFWGGFIVVLGAAEILITYRAPFGILVHFGLYGLAGYLVPIVLALLGVLIVFDPVHRTFYSVLSVIAALGTWLTSNLGGFFIGMLLGLVGGSLAFGWQLGERPARADRAGRGRRRRPRSTTRAAE